MSKVDPSGYAALPASAPTDYRAPQLGSPTAAPRGASPLASLAGGKPAESPIDYGFENHQEFARGVVDVRQGTDALHLEEFESPLTTGSWLCSFLGVTLAALSGLGIIYLATKSTLVRQGEIGMVEHINGRMRILTAGFHVIETVGTKVEKADLNKDFIKHGSLKIIRVLPGHVGLALHNGQPTILLSGRHVVNDPLFVFERQESLTNPHIVIGTAHIITVQQGKVGLCLVDSTAHFLEPGIHTINIPRFAFNGFKDSTEEHINVGSKHRILVPAGKIGLAWEKGEPQLLEPGRTYNIDSPTFKYAGSKSVIDSVIAHGRMKLVTVKQGFWGISYEDGTLRVLDAGRHVLTKATHYLAGFLSAGNQVLSISEVTSMSSDNVGIAFDAAISIKVVDPAKAVTMLCNSDELGFNVKAMHAAIVQKAKLALTIIVGNNRLNNTFRSTTRVKKASTVFDTDAVLDAQPLVAAPHVRAPVGASAATYTSTSALDDDPSNDEDSGSTGSFKQRLHDAFMHSFSSHMLEDCGIQVIDMSIEDIKITNAELARAMAQGAVARTSLVAAQIEQEVTRAKALAAQKARVLEAEAAARSTAIMAEAEANKTRIAALAEAERIRLMAESEAKRVHVIAEAEAARIRKLDDVMKTISNMTQQREMVIAAGDVIRASKSSIILAHSATDVANLLAANRNGAATGFPN